MEIRRPREARGLTIALASASAAVAVFLVVYLLNDRGEAGVRIDTEPNDAVVHIDGRRLPGEHSPFIATKLSSRERHTIVVERLGHESWSTTLKLPAGEIFPLPTVRLDRIKQSDPAPAEEAPPQPKVADAEPPSPSEPAPIAKPPSTARPKRSAVPEEPSVKAVVSPKPVKTPQVAKVSSTGAGGVLRINTRPWSKVSIDGAAVGNTPQMNIKVSAGKHTITLENPQFGVKQQLTLTVKPGETVTRVLTLKP